MEQAYTIAAIRLAPALLSPFIARSGAIAPRFLVGPEFDPAVVRAWQCPSY